MLGPGPRGAHPQDQLWTSACRLPTYHDRGLCAETLCQIHLRDRGIAPTPSSCCTTRCQRKRAIEILQIIKTVFGQARNHAFLVAFVKLDVKNAFHSCSRNHLLSVLREAGVPLHIISALMRQYMECRMEVHFQGPEAEVDLRNGQRQ